jgi:hypothetical protein
MPRRNVFRSECDFVREFGMSRAIRATEYSGEPRMIHCRGPLRGASRATLQQQHTVLVRIKSTSWGQATNPRPRLRAWDATRFPQVSMLPGISTPTAQPRSTLLRPLPCCQAVARRRRLHTMPNPCNAAMHTATGTGNCAKPRRSIRSCIPIPS